jgi:hypothetical protein
MRMRDGRYECQQCGQVLDIAEDAVPRVEMKAASGEPNRRSITLDGREIHSCAMSAWRTVEEAPAGI